MYCPNCGTKLSIDQKFCRSCGLALEKIAQSLAEQLPTKLDESLQEQKNKLERLGVTFMGIFFLGLLILFLYKVGHSLMLSYGAFLAALGLLALVVILGSAVLAIILFAKAKDVEEEAATRRRLQQSKEVSEGSTARLLPESYLEPVPSVAERTTELLLANSKSGAKEADR